MFLRALQPEGIRNVARGRTTDCLPAVPAAWMHAAPGAMADGRAAAPLWPGGRRGASPGSWHAAGHRLDVPDPQR